MHKTHAIWTRDDLSNFFPERRPFLMFPAASPGRPVLAAQLMLGIWPALIRPRERQKDLLSSSFQKEFQLSGAWRGVTSWLHHFRHWHSFWKPIYWGFWNAFWHQVRPTPDHKIIRRTWKCLEWNRWRPDWGGRGCEMSQMWERMHGISRCQRCWNM